MLVESMSQNELFLETVHFCKIHRNKCAQNIDESCSKRILQIDFNIYITFMKLAESDNSETFSSAL